MAEALKNGDKDARMIYSSMVAAIDSKAKEMRVDTLSQAEEVEVLRKMAKQTQESIDACPKSRTDILEKLEFEQKIITSYLPKLMGVSEIEEVIDSVLNELSIENPTVKDKGRIMKVLMPRVKGKADGKLVNKVLMDKIS